ITNAFIAKAESGKPAIITENFLTSQSLSALLAKFSRKMASSEEALSLLWRISAKVRVLLFQHGAWRAFTMTQHRTDSTLPRLILG
ncbi:hypothetical protein ABTF50_20585, partial [Acinetobacter baumannii]